MTGDGGDAVVFRRSRRRVLAFLAGACLPAVLWFSLLNVAFGDVWYDAFPYLPILLLGAVGFYAQLGRQGGLPLTVTRDELVLSRAGEAPLVIGRDNLAVATVRGRLAPTLVLDVADPARTRPVLDSWGWGRLGQWSLTRIRRPHEVHVSLIGVTPGAASLRRLLAERPAAPETPP